MPGKMGSWKHVPDPELEGVKGEMRPWCSHMKGRSGRKAELSCRQRVLSPELQMSGQKHSQMWKGRGEGGMRGMGKVNWFGWR